MKVICVGWNYPKHNSDFNITLPTEPTIFCKADSALSKGNKPFYIPDFSSQIEYEIEVVFRIGKLGKTIAPKFALRYIDAVGLGIDFTARDLQQKCRETGAPWDLCKGFDGSAPVSEFININTFEDIHNIDFRLDINGQTVQSGNTGDMIFKIEDIITYVSGYYTLKIGDLLFSGTPDGTGKVNVGDHLEGYLNNQLLLDFYIK